jgi:hypothetical protein
MCFNYDKYNAKYVNIQTEINFFLKKKQKSSIKGKKMEDYPAWHNSRFLFFKPSSEEKLSCTKLEITILKKV